MACSDSPLFPLITMLLVAALVLVHPAASHRPLIGGCQASGYLPGKSGHCDPGFDSDCCQPGKSYPQYRCSPPVSGHTRAQLTVNCFEENCDGGAPSECDGQYHSDKDMVVALSTGWYHGGSRCHKMIRINGNGRSVVAKVVDECDSVNGCDDDHDFQPPCPNNVVDGSPAVWAALGIDTDVGVYDITWSDE
ncbi:putative ripening-related protein 1 [Zingiber officinale]|nr:putative ripening-related protein 1 [Zingiber officinale]